MDQSVRGKRFKLEPGDLVGVVDVGTVPGDVIERPVWVGGHTLPQRQLHYVVDTDLRGLKVYAQMRLLLRYLDRRQQHRRS